jgi:DNA adenine methylase
MKPPFGWVGSKYRCKDEIISEFPDSFVDYYEPFLGSGAIFFSLKDSGKLFRSAYLSDINKNLIDCMRAITYEPDKVAKVLLECCKKNSEEFYYEMRKFVNKPGVFVYLMRACFSNLYRVNQKGEFNTPWRKGDFEVYKRKISLDVTCIKECSEYLNEWLVNINNLSFDAALTYVNVGDLVYCDPTYIPYSDNGFVAYDKKGFGMDQQKYLHNICKVMKDRGAHVFLSNSYTDKSVQIFGKPHKIIGVSDSVNSTAVDKGKRLEGLWKY